jgi:hypothetical protein
MTAAYVFSSAFMDNGRILAHGGAPRRGIDS